MRAPVYGVMNFRLIKAWWQSFSVRSRRLFFNVLSVFVIVIGLVVAALFEPKSENMFATAKLSECARIAVRTSSRVYCTAHFSDGHIQNILWRKWNHAVTLDFKGEVIVQREKGKFTGRYTYNLVGPAN